MSFLLTICVVIYFFWDRRRKKTGSSIVRKTVWCDVLVLCTLISISAVKVSVEEIKDNYETESKAGRLQRASRERQRGDYGYLAETRRNLNRTGKVPVCTVIGGCIPCSGRLRNVCLRMRQCLYAQRNMNRSF